MTDGGGDGVSIRRCGCRCWWCADCSYAKGCEIRRRLIPRVQAFRSVLMLTLTVDPTLFDSPKDAYEHVKENRCISRLMRELDRAGVLHSKRYFYVFEPHRSGYPHWHIVVDASFIPHALLMRKWGAMRPESAPAWRAVGGGILDDANRPEFGFAHVKKADFASKEHAARYVTKYLSKSPEEGWPEWVLDSGAEKRIRRYDASRGFWGTHSERSESIADVERERVTYRVKVRRCGTSSNIFTETACVHRGTGEVGIKRRWVAAVDIAGTDLARLPGAGGHRRRKYQGVLLDALLEAIGELRGRRVAVWRSKRDRDAVQTAKGIDHGRSNADQHEHPGHADHSPGRHSAGVG